MSHEDIIDGIYDDDGTKINPELIPKPSLCETCFKDVIQDEMERNLCLLNRYDQMGEKEFTCYAYEQK
jgi:hypothetical protein